MQELKDLISSVQPEIKMQILETLEKKEDLDEISLFSNSDKEEQEENTEIVKEEIKRAIPKLNFAFKADAHKVEPIEELKEVLRE